MKKRITAIMTAVVMIFTFAGTTVTAKAATTPFMTVVCDGPVKEKVGNYYIWGKECQRHDSYINDYELICSKKLNKSGKVVKTISDQGVLTTVISNGQIIYYGVFYEEKNEMTIYKTSVTGNVDKKIRTIKNVQTECGPITVFNNRIYYDRDALDIKGNVTWNIYSVTLNNKKCRLEKSGFKGQSGYGRYMTCDNESKNIKTQLYNAKTRKSTALIKSKMSRVYNGKIYYGNWDHMGAYVKKTNLAGKKIKTVGAVMAESQWHITYLGKKMAYFLNTEWGFNNKCKLLYATGKIVKVK